MAKRKWIFGSLSLAIGFLVGHIVGSSPARSTTFAGAGIPLAISAPSVDRDVHRMASIESSTQSPDRTLNSEPPVQETESLDLIDVTFCHKISNFGNYLTYPIDEFSAGQEVLIYAQIGGLHSEQNVEGKFRTVVKSTIEVLRDGEPQERVESIVLPETVDLCCRQRHDYFHSYQFTIPGKLTAGQYVLRLTVQDQLDHREANRSLVLSIK